MALYSTGTRIDGPRVAGGTDERMAGSYAIGPGEVLELEYDVSPYLSLSGMRILTWDLRRRILGEFDVTIPFYEYGNVWIPADNEHGGRWHNIIRLQVKPKPQDTGAGAAPVVLLAVGAVLGSIATFLATRVGLYSLREWKSIVEIQSGEGPLTASVVKWVFASLIAYMGWQTVKEWRG